MQAAQKQESRDLQESGLEGKDAFGELVRLSSSTSSSTSSIDTVSTSGDRATHRNNPREDLERLYRDANEGMVVAGREATWEATRPSVLPAGKSQKLRGFIDYRRHAAPHLCLSMLVNACDAWDMRAVSVKEGSGASESLAAQVAYRLCNLATTFPFSRPLASHLGGFFQTSSLPTDAAAGTWRMRCRA